MRSGIASNLAVIVVAGIKWLPAIKYGCASIMNKGELVAAVAKKAGVTAKMAETILTATTDSIMGAVSSGDKVTLVGFGTFEKRDRSERQGRNPRSGETMTIPATSVPAFAAGKMFRNAVAGSEEEQKAA